MPTDPASGSWHLDKRVPLTMITAIAIQTLVVASILTKKSVQIDDHEKRIERVEISERTVDGAINEWVRRAAGRQQVLDEHSSKIVKLEANDITLNSTATAILQQLSRIDERTMQLGAALIEVRNEVRQIRNNTQPRQ